MLGSAGTPRNPRPGCENRLLDRSSWLNEFLLLPPNLSGRADRDIEPRHALPAVGQGDT